jgi:hypothetical protein
LSISVRQSAASCLGVTGPFSIRKDVFGYIWGPMACRLSLNQQLTLIKDKAFNLSLILVAHEPDFSGEFTPAETIKMQAAIDIMRELYAQVDLGVRKLYWQYIPRSQAGGYTVVDDSEATDLTEDWSGNNDGIDVFFVTEITDASGWSNVDGPCDKEAICGRTGAVMMLHTSDQWNGIVLAHELGHYLKLEHGNDITNVMGVDDGDSTGQVDLTSTGITTSQGNKMKTHCSIRPSCQ